MRGTLAARFGAKWKLDPATGCWLWTAFRNAGGYGQIAMGGRKAPRWLAHRASLFIHRGIDAGEMQVCHRCDRPQCVNPDHLFIGTQTDNMQDCSAKGRINKTIMPLGESHGMRKLTVDAVREIRRTEGRTSEFARRFGVSITTIKYVRRGAVWRHVA